jgi:DNA-binding NtrC family response regulator
MNERPAQAAGRPTVMVVDDEPRVCQLLERLLREEGYHVVTAQSGQRALTLAAEASSDVIVLDIVMPGLDGVATLRKLRSRGLSSAVIMLTAQGTVRTAREAMRLGAYDYITKPFDPEFLKSVLRGALRDRSERRNERACAR